MSGINSPQRRHIYRSAGSMNRNIFCEPIQAKGHKHTNKIINPRTTTWFELIVTTEKKTQIPEIKTTNTMEFLLSSILQISWDMNIVLMRIQTLGNPIGFFTKIIPERYSLEQPHLLTVWLLSKTGQSHPQLKYWQIYDRLIYCPRLLFFLSVSTTLTKTCLWGIMQKPQFCGHNVKDAWVCERST